MGSNLLDGDLMGLAPLHADSGIQIVQLARAQGNCLKRIYHVYICSQDRECLFLTLFSCLSVFWISSFSSCSRSLRNRVYNQFQKNGCKVISNWQKYYKIPLKTHFWTAFFFLSCSALSPPFLAAWSEVEMSLLQRIW